MSKKEYNAKAINKRTITLVTAVAVLLSSIGGCLAWKGFNKDGGYPDAPSDVVEEVLDGDDFGAPNNGFGDDQPGDGDDWDDGDGDDQYDGDGSGAGIGTGHDSDGVNDGIIDGSDSASKDKNGRKLSSLIKGSKERKISLAAPITTEAKAGKVTGKVTPSWSQNTSKSSGGSSGGNGGGGKPNPPVVPPINYDKPGKFNPSVAGSSLNDKTAASYNSTTVYQFDNASQTGILQAFNYTAAKASNPNVIPTRTNDGTKDVSESKKLTVLLYICGTDLESKAADNMGGLASYDIYNMIRSQYDLSKVNVLVCAGGTNWWINDYMATTCGNNNLNCCIYAVNPDAYNPNDKNFNYKTLNADVLPLLAKFDSSAGKMGEAGLLAGFIDFATEYFPAENYGLIFNNHGGGINDGVCFPAAPTNGNPASDSLKSYTIEAALAKTKEFGSGTENRMSFIAMDACMMGSAEMAVNLAPYCEYYVGASEIELGSYSYQDLMKRISSQCDNYNSKTVAGMIVSSYFNPTNFDADNATYHHGTGNIADTVAFESNGVYALYEEIDALSGKLISLQGNSNCATLWSNCLAAIDTASIHADFMGMTDSDTGSYYRGYVDALGFLKLLQANLQKNSASLNADEKAALADINAQFDKIYSTQFISSGGVYYEKESVYQLGNAGRNYSFNDVLASGGWNSGKWAGVKGAGAINSGVSLYVPRVYGEAESYNSSALSGKSGEMTVKNMETYKDLGIFSNYTNLMYEYVKHQCSGQVASDRTALIQNIQTYSYLAAIKPIEGTGGNAQVLLERVYKKSNNQDYIDYIKIRFNSVEDCQNNTSGNTMFSYDDVAKTIDSLTLYVEKYQDVKLKTPVSDGNGGTIDDANVKLVIGEVAVPLYGLSGGDNSLNILPDTLAKALAVRAFGTAENSQYSYAQVADEASKSYIVDWARRGAGDEGTDTATEIRLEGYTVTKTADTNTFSIGTKCVLVFKDRGDESGWFDYDSAEVLTQDSEGKDVNTGSKVSDVNYISFVHYCMTENSNGTVFYNTEVLETSDKYEFYAPVYDVKYYVTGANGQELDKRVSVYRESLNGKEMETSNSYDMKMVDAGNTYSILQLDTAEEEANKTNHSEAVWGLAPSDAATAS